MRRQLPRAVRRLGGQVHAVISTDVFLDVYGACGEQRRVYWWQDDPVGGAASTGAPTAERLGRAEERLARASDLIVAVNEIAVARWQERGLRAAHLPNGCDASYFAGVDESDAAADVDLPGPVAGFVGHINSRTDLGAARGGGGRRRLAPARRPQGPVLRAGAVRATGRAAQRGVCRGPAVRGAALVLEGDRRRTGPLRDDRVQPVQLPHEDPRIPGGRPSGRGHLAAGRALARHGSRDARRHPGRLRGLRRTRCRAGAAIPRLFAAAASSRRTTAGRSVRNSSRNFSGCLPSRRRSERRARGVLTSLSGGHRRVRGVRVRIGASRSGTRSRRRRRSRPAQCMPKPSACGFPDQTNTGVGGRVVADSGRRRRDARPERRGVREQAGDGLDHRHRGERHDPQRPPRRDRSRTTGSA